MLYITADSQSKSHGHGGDMSGMTTTTRLNSIHLRELKRGAFIMKYEDLKHLECIGQGALKTNRMAI